MLPSRVLSSSFMGASSYPPDLLILFLPTYVPGSEGKGSPRSSSYTRARSLVLHFVMNARYSSRHRIKRGHHTTNFPCWKRFAIVM